MLGLGLSHHRLYNLLGDWRGILYIISLLFQKDIFVRLTGMGRGVSHQGRVVPLNLLQPPSKLASRSTTLDLTSEKSRTTTLEMTSEKSFISTEKILR